MAVQYLSTADYDAIRSVLGTTKLDVDDALIEQLPFGPQAVLMLSERADLATLYGQDVSPPPSRVIVKLALVYATGALIAEQYGKGGLVSNLRPEGGQRNVAADAAALWQYFERYQNELVGEGFVSLLTFLVEDADFDAVRDQLGRSDLDNRAIASPAFGGFAERMVKQALPGWEQIVAEGTAAEATPVQKERLTALRLATMYATSGLYARAYAGQAVDYSTGQNWTRYSNELFGMYSKMVGFVRGGFSTLSTVLMVAGPTRQRKVQKVLGVGHQAPWLG